MTILNLNLRHLSTLAHKRALELSFIGTNPLGSATDNPFGCRRISPRAQLAVNESVTCRNVDG
jgi:hypothetical protein